MKTPRGPDQMMVRSLSGLVTFLCLASVAQADHLKPLPVKPEKPPCIVLEGESEVKKSGTPEESVVVCLGELIEHDASRAFIHGNTLVLRKNGHTYSSAKLRYKLPKGVAAGKYSVWTCFTLGGVAVQNFTILAGADPKALEKRASFRQSNGVSWKIAWRKAGVEAELKEGDKWIEVHIAGMATQQKQIDALLLAPLTESVRLRAAVGKFRGRDLLRQFTVLEGTEPAEANVFLRYFAERADELRDSTTVKVADGAEADRIAKRLSIPKRPALVVAERFLTAPVTAAEVAEFVRSVEDTPRLLLQAESRPAKVAGAADDREVYGELVSHTADRLVPSRTGLVLRKDGYVWHTATVRWTLPEKVQPGKYDVWTLFTLGGVATQTFKFRVGHDPEHLEDRMSFSQSNGVSWRTEWRKGATQLKLYPGEKCVEVVVTGMATQQKQLDAFQLVLAEELPKNVTIESGRWRAAADSVSAAEPQYRAYILESEDGKDGDAYFRYIATQLAPEMKEKMAITTFTGGAARDLAKRIRLEELPALLVMDDRYALRGVLSGKTDGERVGALFASTTKAGNAPGPFLTRARHTLEEPQPLRKGLPHEWLVVDGWGGRAGFSLWGIDYEARLRPNPGDAFTANTFDSGKPKEWAPRTTTEKGVVLMDAATGDYSWARGVGYAHVYLEADDDTECVLHTAHTGIGTVAWLDGERVALERDPAPSAAFSGSQEVKLPTVVSANDQGGKVSVTLGRKEAPRLARLRLTKGWHRLLVKLVMQHPKDEVFSFAARFTDAKGPPLTGVKTQLSDPGAAHAIRADASRLHLQVHVDAPSNLPHPGQPLKLRFDLRWQRPRGRAGLVLPIIPFDAGLTLVMTDYDGREVARREIQTQFPAVLTVDFGETPEAGYYAVHATLADEQGQSILVCPPDGFSVIRGTEAQFERRAKKEMAVTYYFMGSGDRATYHKAFPWMTRMGLYRNIGSSPGFPEDMAEAASKAGIVLTMDFWDIHNAYTQQKRDELAEKAAAYTEWFKSFNEVDIHHRVRKTPEHWVARTKGEYEAVRAACLDGVFVGGSLVRPGSDDWFTDCLKLGLDKYVDVWDVHAYPQHAPTLEGTLSNSTNETELGVLTCYKRAGLTNTKPFWIGETGARACHGLDARRWQAATIAKMVACVCSREDFQYVGFLWPWTYGRRNDIVTAHMPGEAAYYAASALIDGFPYTRLDLGDKRIQAALFGETRMLWTTGPPSQVRLPLPDAGPWVIVDVVGRVRDLALADNNTAQLALTGNPVYVLKKATYEALTAFREE